jgi:hypothetical protein
MANRVSPDNSPQLLIDASDSHNALVETFLHCFTILGLGVEISRAQNDDPAGVAECTGRDSPLWLLVPR